MAIPCVLGGAFFNHIVLAGIAGPIVATALTLNCPIWTEDQDFFRTGIPTWTTDRIHIYFETAAVR